MSSGSRNRPNAKVPNAAKGLQPHRVAPISRRKIWLVVTGGSLVAIAFLSFVVWTSLPKKLTQSERTLLRQYEMVRAALAADDLAAAKKASATLRASSPNATIFAKSAETLEKSESLESARYAFKAMSEEAVDLVKGNHKYFVISCAMNRCPAQCSPCQMYKFGPWVQNFPTIENPFMGKASPHCGVIN